MSKSIGLPVAAGLSSAVLYLMVVTGKPLGVLLIYLTPLPLVVLGLSYGLLPVVGGVFVGLIAVAAVMLSATPSFAVVAGIPALVVVRQSLQWRKTPDGTIQWRQPGNILGWVVGAATVLLVLLAAFVTANGVGFEAVVSRHVAKFVDVVASAVPADMRQSIAGLWAALLPAIAGFVWVAAAALNGVVGQWVATRAKRALRPTPAYRRLEMPAWAPVVMMGAAVAGLATNGDVGYVCRNIAALILASYVFVGLSVIHPWLKGRNNGAMLLGLFYVVFFVLFGWALIAVAGLGLVRHWTRLLRHGAAGGQEEK